MSTEHAGFPKLMWLADGREVTVQDQDEQERIAANGGAFVAPGAAPAPASDDEREPATFGPADDGTGEGPTFSAADAAVYGDEADEATADDNKPARRGGKKK